MYVYSYKIAFHGEMSEKSPFLHFITPAGIMRKNVACVLLVGCETNFPK